MCCNSLGNGFASKEIIDILSKIKYPYNVNQLTQQQAISMLHKHYEIERWVKTLKEERDYLEAEFENFHVPLNCSRPMRISFWQK